jgi:hypothetical protein
MAIPDSINSKICRGQAVIAVRALDVAHMTWIAAEVESERALRAWFDTGTPQDADAYRAYREAVDREEVAANDLQRLSELTQPSQERLAQSE